MFVPFQTWPSVIARNNIFHISLNSESLPSVYLFLRQSKISPFVLPKLVQTLQKVTSNSSCNITLNKSIFYLPKSYHNLFMRRRAREYGGKKFVHILCLPKTYNNLFMRRRREHGGKKSTKRSRSKWWLYSVWLSFYFWIMGIYCQSLGKCSLIFHFSSVILNCYSIFCVWYVLLYLNIFDHMLWLPWLWVHTWHIHLHVSISPRDLA